MRTLTALTLVAVAATACAGRQPDESITTTRATDATATCEMMQGEYTDNGRRMQALENEREAKRAQNIVMGVGGLFLWPLWLGTDFRGGAKADLEAMERRQTHLRSMMIRQDCAIPPAPVPSVAPPKKEPEPEMKGVKVS